jgi:hypothetical protein
VIERSQQRTSRSTLLRRFHSLALGEATNVVLQPLIFLGWLDVPPSLANLVGFGLFILILIQGSAYWLVKHRQIKQGLSEPSGIHIFAILQWINAGALAVGILLLLPTVAANATTSSWPGLVFWACALLEYVNYFHIQLIPTSSFRGWQPRIAHLACDLRQNRERK